MFIPQKYRFISISIIVIAYLTIIWSINTIYFIFATDKELVQGNGFVPFFFSLSRRKRIK